MLDLKGFNENQIKAVQHIDGACVVIAGAGSGKTKVLTYRIANLIEHGIMPDNILAMTFTKKASDEMKARLRQLIGIDAEQVHMGTFHSICYSILRAEYGEGRFEIAPEWWQKKTVKEIMQPRSNKYPYGIGLDWQPRQALAFIGYQKNNLIRPHETLIMSESQSFMEDKLRELYKQYEKAKQRENKIDFDDMLVMAYDLLKSNPEVLGRYRNRFKYILVDEYQDTNLAQSEILRLLAEKHRNLFVVGDDYQSIYGFRASRVDLIIEFEKEWNAKVIPLDINYRSTANIVEWSNKLIRNNKKQYPKEVKANARYYKDPVIIKALDEDEEAEIIADEIQNLMEEGYKPQDFCILYRTNAQSRALEEQMMKHKFPYVVIGSANFYDRREIKDMLAYLRLADDPHDDEALRRIINTPNRFLGKAFVDGLELFANREGISLFDALVQSPMCKEWRYQGARKLHNIILKLTEHEGTTAQILSSIRYLTDYDNWLVKEDTSSSDDEENERLENLNALQSTAYKFKTIDEFLSYVDSMSSKTNDKDETGKIKLMTIHRSKGLEFKVTFVAGVGEELLPHRNAIDDEDIEEERRLCYVAMTRAEKLLYMSFSEYYQGRECGASIFIDELLAKSKEVELPWL